MTCFHEIPSITGFLTVGSKQTKSERETETFSNILFYFLFALFAHLYLEATVDDMSQHKGEKREQITAGVRKEGRLVLM